MERNSDGGGSGSWNDLGGSDNGTGDHTTTDLEHFVGRVVEPNVELFFFLIARFASFEVPEAFFGC